jgi:hypothetical protein
MGVVASGKLIGERADVGNNLDGIPTPSAKGYDIYPANWGVGELGLSDALDVVGVDGHHGGIGPAVIPDGELALIKLQDVCLGLDFRRALIDRHRSRTRGAEGSGGASGSVAGIDRLQGAARSVGKALPWRTRLYDLGPSVTGATSHDLTRLADERQRRVNAVSVLGHYNPPCSQAMVISRS